MFYNLKLSLKKIFPRGFILWTHKLRAMAAAFLCGFPGRKIKVIGVAGTKGKTTTTNLIAAVLEKAGYKVAMFSTANMRLAGKEFLNTVKLTTPSPFFLSKFLKKAIDEKCDYAVVEISSHALVQHRLYGIDFKKAVITNLMPDHLDYHRTADEYTRVHLKMIGPKTEAVIVNGEDGAVRNLQAKIESDNLKLKILQFGFAKVSDFRGYGVRLSGNEVRFRAEHQNLPCQIISSISSFSQGMASQGRDLGEFVLNIPGNFNAYNALAAITLGISEGIDPDKIREALAGVAGVPGRLEKIKISPGQDFEVVVDYAHSPDSLRNVYEAVKPYVKNRLIAVLGGTGDRDKTYRSRAGALADKFADIVVVTNEDPYSEDPEAIIDQVWAGIKNKKPDETLFRISDRKEAVEKAVNLAQKGDTILITGKGSEQFMIWGDKKIPWDDRKVAREALEKRFPQK